MVEGEEVPEALILVDLVEEVAAALLVLMPLVCLRKCSPNVAEVVAGDFNFQVAEALEALNSILMVVGSQVVVDFLVEEDSQEVEVLAVLAVDNHKIFFQKVALLVAWASLSFPTRYVMACSESSLSSNFFSFFAFISATRRWSCFLYLFRNLSKL